MVWNPFRLLKTLVHFEVAGPLSRGLRHMPGMTDSGVTPTALDGASLEPEPGLPMVWLPGAAAAAVKSLTQALEPLGYGLTTAPWEGAAALVNTPLVVWGRPGADLALESALEQLKQRAIYQEARLIDFCRPDPAVAALWGSLDDGVMGGVSTSQVHWQGGLRFAGHVSTANSGGFASIRTRNLEPPLNLGRWQGTVLQVRGDGQRYKWILRDNPGWDSLAYCRSFDTDADGLSTVRTAFLEMVATRRARTIPAATPLNPARLYSMQLMLSKFEYDGALNPAFDAGAFGLTVQSLRVYRQGPQPVVVLPRETANVGHHLAAAELTGVIPQAEGFEVVGASDRLPPQVNPEAVRAILSALA
ncbi:CIA30 family protein [Nodosilinea sp. PGN35]|uniref:CIA30 family protein n=1 Tax=Nodosilinea sp. PGN35 TaxID=3020489 RepID=UPI0023B2E1A5|nr:CIA30 family protein [Nodosilinea sp. TSF1-S3]MDF0368139.1 CIA30 family protein [Nodosilinea sp. TSF1-S3]